MHNFNHPSKYGKIIISVIFIAIIYIFAFHYLWNWLMPKIFDLPELTIWESIGMLALAKIIFGGFGKTHHCKSKHCDPLSEEEKADYKQKFESWCSKAKEEKKD